MFIVKLFRNGTRDPDQIEFYSTEAPIVKRVQDPEFPDTTHQIEISNPNSHEAEDIDVNKGDNVYIENADGVTIHSIR